jgi:hypothetical protein
MSDRDETHRLLFIGPGATIRSIALVRMKYDCHDIANESMFRIPLRCRGSHPYTY